MVVYERGWYPSQLRFVYEITRIYVQVHFGAPWPVSFASLVRSKFGSDPLTRKIALEGHRFTPQEALEAGIVDYLVNGDTAAVLARAVELAHQWSVNAQAGAWGSIKVVLFPFFHRPTDAHQYCHMHKTVRNLS